MKTDTQEIGKTLAVGKSKRGLFRRFWWVALLLAIAFAVMLRLDKGEQRVAYNSVKPQQKDLVVTVSATGNLEPTNSVDIGIEVSGTISEVLADYNDRVKKGDILAKLDTTKLLSQANSAKASLQVAKAKLDESRVTLKDAEREYHRLQSLYKATDGNYPPTKDIDAAQITYEKAEASLRALAAQVAQAEASLRSDEDDLKKAVVVSPIDGIVLDKAVEVGQSVVTNMEIPTLFTLAQDLTKMEVIVSVDEADVGAVKEGQPVVFTVDAYPSRTFTGVIKQVRMNSEMVNNVVTYETVVTADNPEQLLRPGMTVSADITTKVIKDALMVPNAALRFSPPVVKAESDGGFRLFGPLRTKEKSDLSMSTKSLWILDGGMARKIPVSLGESDGLNTVILEGNMTKSTDVIVSIEESGR